MIPEVLILQLENNLDHLGPILCNSATDRLPLMGNIRNNRGYPDIRSLILLIRIVPKTHSKLQNRLEDILNPDERNELLLYWENYLENILKVKKILISNNIDVFYTPKVIDPLSPLPTYETQFTFSYPQPLTQKVSQDSQTKTKIKTRHKF